MPGGTPPPVPAPRRRFMRKRIMIPAVVILLAAILAGGYFGYYMNSSVILSQSLSRTGKGYNKLVDYFDTQSKTKYKGSTASGTYTLKAGSTSTDGSLDLKSSGANSDMTFNVGLGATRVNAEVRSIKSASGKTPDLYLKASGIKGLGDLLGSSDQQTAAAIDSLDGKWIAVDHTLLDNLSSTDTGTTMSLPTEAQVMDELKAFGKVNQQYVFTTDKKKSVTTVVKKYGTESVDGHKTYHYKMALNKANVKTYITAQQKALNASQLGAWIKKNDYQDTVNDYFKSLQTSADSISNKDDFDLWADTHSRLIYKVRIPDDKNPASNYVDVGLNYKGGSSYPFFIGEQSKDDSNTSSGSLVATIDSKTNSLTLQVSFKSTSSGSGDPSNYNFKANLTYKPTNNVTTISAPTGAEPLSQVLDELGLGDILTSLSQSSGSIREGEQDKAQDTKRQVDIQAIQTQLEVFFSENGYYPSLADMNSGAWVNDHLSSLDQGALEDPNGSARKLAARPAAKVYAYQVTDSSGKSCENNDTQCAKYILTATLSDGSAYTQTNLD